MPWFTVDDGFADHPKVIRCSLAAIGLWTKAGSYCARHLTDGKIPKVMIRVWGGTPKLVAELVAHGLWLDAGPDSYEFHDWSERNPLSAEVKAKRAADAARKKSERADSKRSPSGRPNGHPHGQAADIHTDSDGSPRARARVPSHPIPTSPIPSEGGELPPPNPDLEQEAEMRPGAFSPPPQREPFNSRTLEALFSRLRSARKLGTYRLQHTDYDKAQNAVAWAHEHDDPPAACEAAITAYLDGADKFWRDKGFGFGGFANDPAAWYARATGALRSTQSGRADVCSSEEHAAEQAERDREAAHG